MDAKTGKKAKPMQSVVTHVLTGSVLTWKIGAERKFSFLSLPFHLAKELCRPSVFDSATRKGEQRSIADTHARKLLEEMRAGTFTPTPWAAGTTAAHRKAITMNNGAFSLSVDSLNPLPLTDGGHRREAMMRCERMVRDMIAVEASPKKKLELEAQLELILSSDIPIMVYLDGQTQSDFINLQQGKSVDKSHMLSLAATRRNSDPELNLAFAIAQSLNKESTTPFESEIKFDTTSTRPLPVSTLMARGAGDIGTSLIGMARIMRGTTRKVAYEDYRFGAMAVIQVYQSLQVHGKDLLKKGMPLALPRNDGTKGSATMLVGVANVVAWRIDTTSEDETTLTDEMHEDLIRAAHAAFSDKVDGNFSGPVKRRMLGNFAREFFRDWKGEKHEGVPLELIHILSSSTFDVAKVGKPKPKAVLHDPVESAEPTEPTEEPQ